MRRLVMSLFAVVLGLGLSLAPAVQPPASGQAWVPPEVTRLIGGPSEPQVFAWGLDYDPVNDELLVSDYLNRSIRRFDRDGNLVGSFGQDASALGFFAGVAVDPSDGTVYTHTFGGDSDFVRFAPDRSEAGRFDLSGLSAFLAFGADGYLYGNSHKCCNVKKIDPTSGSEEIVATFGRRGSDPGEVAQVTGVDVATDGRVYAVDPGQGVVHVWNANGSSNTEFGSKGSGPGRLPGDARGIALDEANDRAYVADSDEGEIEVFTLDGVYVDTWGGIGTGPGEFSDGARELAVTPDGHLWAADYGNQRLQEFTPQGVVAGVYPAPAQPADSWGMSRPRDVTVDSTTGEILVADPWNQRFQRYTAEGELIETRGRRGSNPPEGVNYPRSVGVDPATGNVWLPNYEGVPGITVYGPDGGLEFSIQVPQFANDVQFHQGEAYVPFRGGDGIIRVFDTSTGLLTRTIDIDDVLNGVAIDPATGTLYVAMDRRGVVRMFDQSGAALGDLAMPDTPWGVEIAGDTIYASDTAANVVVAFDKDTGTEVGRFGSGGSGIGQLRNPSGLDLDAQGNLYVAEAGNNRVSVFSWTSLPGDVIDPTAVITAPTDGSTQGAPLVIEGTASDTGRGVGTVEVLVQDRTTGLWWDADRALWGGWKRNASSVYGDLAAPSWRFTVVGAQPGGSYFVQVRVTDLAGNESAQRPSLAVDVADVSGPAVQFVSPDPGPIPAGVVTITGAAQDDQGVAAVEARVIDPITGLTWDPDIGTWTSAPGWQDAQLDAAGAQATAWTVDTAAVLPGGIGSLVVEARGRDLAGNVGGVVARTFERPGVDVIAPTTTLDEPNANDQYVDVVSFRGTVADDQAVADVVWSVKDRVTNLWFDAVTDTWGGYRLNQGGLDLQGQSSPFQLDVALPEGEYWGAVRAIDAAGNVDESAAGSRFSIVSEAGGIDETPPSVTYELPQDVAPPMPTAAGTASDDVAVAAVQVAFRNRITGQWWDVAAESWGTFAWNDAVLDQPGTTGTSWSMATALPVGDYWSTARALDSSGNESTRVARRHAVVATDDLVQVDLWEGYSGTSLGDIPSGTAPTRATQASLQGGLSVETSDDNFGARVRAVITPQASGDYTFWLASDDQGSLRLDPAGIDAASAVEIASVPGWTGLRDWTKYSQQQSEPIALVAGTAYYLEGVFKEGGGGDHIAVAWQLDGNDSPTVIPAAVVSWAGDIGDDGWEQ